MRTGIQSLGDFSITAAATQVGTPVVSFEGAQALSVQMRLSYGAGGTNIKAYLQTSLDQGTTWIDIACVLFGTAGEVAVFNLSGLTPKTVQLTPSDGVLADDTVVDGVLGDRFRVKVISTGTYASSTTLAIRVLPR